MNKNKIISALVVLISATVFSCVSSKQFKEIQGQNQNLQIERDSLLAKNEKLTVANTEISSQIEKLRNELAKLKREQEARIEEFERIEKEYQLMKRGYFDLQRAQQELVKGNNRETRRLLTELQKTQEDLQAREDKLRELEKSLGEKKRNLEELQYEVEKRNARLLELEEILNQKDEMMAELKSKVSKALLGFENNGLTITQKNGKVYVSMDEKLLFKSGSWAVDQRGEQALKNIARVLEQNADISIMIEGHTDNVPYSSKSGQIQDNWDLSVKRATSIVKILLENSSVDPKRVTASGRGEYYPLDMSNTVEGRQKNRRTEIILTPDLDELYKILDMN